MAVFQFEANDHLDRILNPRNEQEANDVVRIMAMGFFREYLKKAKNYASVITKLENWIAHFTTDQEFASIPFAVRHRIMKAMWTAVMKEMMFEFPTQNSDSTAFFIRWNMARGDAIIHIEDITDALRVNTV